MNNAEYSTVKDLPDLQRPYDKCERYGAEVLSDAELLSVIIRTGTVNSKSIDVSLQILKHNNYGGLFNLHNMTLHELREFNGIGRVKAIQLKCISELTKRMVRMTRTEGECFTTPDIIAKYYMEDLRHMERECLLVVMLDSKCRRVDDIIISSGTVNSSVASTRDIFCQALKHNAVKIILLHNHPSGDPSPSREDLYVTSRIKEAGEILDIPLLDHIIIGDNCYFSMKESGHV